MEENSVAQPKCACSCDANHEMQKRELSCSVSMPMILLHIVNLPKNTASPFRCCADLPYFSARINSLLVKEISPGGSVSCFHAEQNHQFRQDSSKSR